MNKDKKMTASTKKHVETFVKPMFEAFMPSVEIEENLYNNKAKIIEPIKFGKPLTDLVKQMAVKLGFVLDGVSIDNKVKETLEGLESLPKSYIGMVKLANSMSKEVYNTVDEFVPYMKLNWTGSFPIERKTWNNNSFDYKTMELLIKSPSLTEEQFLESISNLTRDTESGPEPLASHRIQPNYKMAIKWINMIQIFNEHLTKDEIENLLSE